MTPATGWEAFLLVLGLGLAAPIAEESLFRGVIQQTLEARTDVTRGVLLTSLIFASLHLQYWWLIQLLLMAVILGYLAWRWDSIIPAVMIHAANNLWSFWITLLPEEELSRFYLWKGQLHPALWAAGIALVAGGLFWSEQQENT